MLYIVKEMIRTGERPMAFRRNKIDEGLADISSTYSASGPDHDVVVVAVDILEWLMDFIFSNF